MNMSIKGDYNAWSANYDTNHNKTRDIEAVALRNILGQRRFKKALEAGCGTGKNTVWLMHQCEQLLAVDFSAGMLSVARGKVRGGNVTFQQADLLERWPFEPNQFDLVVFSLVLEHIENLNHVFAEASRVLSPGGMVYVGELHPFKQYTGAKARFGSDADTRELTCYTHHISSFYTAATDAGLVLSAIEEHFDAEAGKPPRLLTLLFGKN